MFPIFDAPGFRVRCAVKRARRSLTLAAPSLALLLAACQRESSSGKAETRSAAVDVSALGASPFVSYADLAHAIYGDATEAARVLLSQIERLLAEPSAERLTEARAAWLAARRPYLQSEVFRFYDGPIDRVETFVNAWPIDEGYVEAGPLGPNPGVVEDFQAHPTLSAELLTRLNASEGETSISTGYHVVEYLLWGRDTRAEGPGDRPFTDYVTREDAKTKTPAEESARARTSVRRARYLQVATELLVRHLGEVRDAWAPGATDNYRSKFLRLPPTEALGLVIRGMGSLSGPELAGERLTVPYETKDEENEHSCFSDTTQLDVIYDALGIENVCIGRYQRVDGSWVRGPGVCEVVALRDAALGQRLKLEVSASVEAARRIPAPFDQAIVGADAAPGRLAIRSTIEALQRQTETLAKVAASFDIRLSLADPRARR